MIKFLKKAEKFYKVGIILIDLALINIAYILAFLIKFNWNLPDFNFDPYLKAMPFITVAALVYFDVFGLLKFYRKTLYDSIYSIIIVVFILGITTVAIAYFGQGFSFPRSVLILAPVFQFIFLTLWNGLVLYIRRIASKGLTLMIVGDKEEVNTVMDKVSYGLRKENLTVKYVFNTKQIEQITSCLKKVDEVLLCSGVTDAQKMEIIQKCIQLKKVVYIVPQLFEISLFKSRMVQFEDIPAFMIDRLGLTVEQRFFKRLFDLFVSIPGLILVSPIMLVVACIIRLTSPGPAIFKQERITKNNEIYNIYKFRTMSIDAEKYTGPVIAEKDDPRTTSIGKVLRKFKLDELPQLLNVILGHMSIVGPRPERPFFVEQFCKEIPEYQYRALMKAGLTGYAQVLGKYDTSPEDKLRYDLLYIKNYSLLLDIKLILRTFRVLFAGDGLYQREVYNDNKYRKNRNKAVGM